MPNISPPTNEYTDARLELYAKLAEAEVEVASGEAGAHFGTFAKELRTSLQSRFILA